MPHQFGVRYITKDQDLHLTSATLLQFLSGGHCKPRISTFKLVLTKTIVNALTKDSRFNIARLRKIGGKIKGILFAFFYENKTTESLTYFFSLRLSYKSTQFFLRESIHEVRVLIWVLRATCMTASI